MHFTGDVSLGTILTIVTLLAIAMRFGYRLGQVETTMKNHAATIAGHAARLSSYEGQIVGFVGDLSRVIGRLEVLNLEAPERRKNHR